MSPPNLANISKSLCSKSSKSFSSSKCAATLASALMTALLTCLKSCGGREGATEATAERRSVQKVSNYKTRCPLYLIYRDARMHLKIALMILKVTSRGVSTENVSQFSPALWAVWGLLSILPHLLQFGYISNCVFLTLLTSQNGHPLL